MRTRLRFQWEYKQRVEEFGNSFMSLSHFLVGFIVICGKCLSYARSTPMVA